MRATASTTPTTVRAAAVFAIVVLLGAPSHATDGVRLAFASETDKTVGWRLTSRTRGGTTFRAGDEEGEGVERKLSIDLAVDYRTLERGVDEEGKLIVEVALDAMAIRMTQDGSSGLDVRMRRDGVTVGGIEEEAAADPELGKQLEAVFGGPVARLRMPANGSPTEVESLAGELYAELSDFDAGAMVALLQPAFPEATEAVQVGARWTARRPVPTGQLDLDRDVEMDLELVLKGVEGDVASIVVTGKTELTGLTAKTGEGESGMKLDVSRLVYDVIGRMKFDVAQGRLLASELDLAITLEGRPAGSHEDVTITMELPTAYVLERRELPAEGSEKR